MGLTLNTEAWREVEVGGPYHTGCSETRAVGESPRQTVLMEKQHIRMVTGKEPDAAA